MNTQDLITKLQDNDEKVRTDAWLAAGEVAAPAIKPLADLVATGELEVSRAAKRAMWKIVRHVGRPGADDEKKPVVTELIGLCGKDQPVAVRREVVWMLSEIAGDEAVGIVGGLLTNKDLREDARMALERIPGDVSLSALQMGLAAAGDDFKPNMAQSLRARGVEVPGLPCRKLTPVKGTQVKPVGR